MKAIKKLTYKEFGKECAKVSCYGVAYHDRGLQQVCLAIFPLNLVLRFMRAIYYRLIGDYKTSIYLTLASFTACNNNDTFVVLCLSIV